MTRLEDWRRRLGAEIGAAAIRPWQWGEGPGVPHDCLAFYARCLLAVTGIDAYADFRGRYRDEASAAALVPDTREFLEQFAAEHRMKPVSPGAAADGDMALFDKGVPIVGVIYGRLVFPAKPSGLRTVTRFAATRVWAVGYD